MPLTFDFPFETLKTYTGINPRPDDFDSYWAAALAELEATPAESELVSATFKPGFADCHDLWFTGVGGARVHAKLVRPNAECAGRRQGKNGLGPAVLLFHGYTGHSGDWQSKLALAASGFTVAALDCRGQGGLSQDTGGVLGNTHQGHIVRGLVEAIEGKPEKLLYRALFMDTVRLARLVMAMDGVDPARVAASGWSQGGGLTLACAALEPRIAKAAPVYPFLSDYKRVWEMDMAKDAYVELRDWFRRFDPLHKREDDVFRALGYIDIQHLAPRVKAEVLMGMGLMDTICPPSTQMATYNKLTCKKATLVYPDFGHEDLPSHHDRILDFLCV